MADYFTIVCLVFGNQTPFSVEISRDATVDELKLVINARKELVASTDATHLSLYLVNIPANKDLEKILNQRLNTEPALEALNPAKKLSALFPETPAEETVYISVQIGPSGVKRKALPVPDNGVAAKRRRIFEDSLSISAFGGGETYKQLDPTKLAFDQPPASESIPLAIFHPIFGEFVEEARTYELTATDNALVRDLRNLRWRTYDTKVDCSEFRRVLCQHYTDIQLDASYVGSTMYVSNGRFSVGEFMSSVSKGELWKGTEDPEGQAASARHSFKRAGDYPDRFPYMIIYIIGSAICFAGAVLTDRLHLETLTLGFSMHLNYHESQITTQAARTLGAFRHAVQKVQDHYAGLSLKREPAFASGKYERLIYPYRCHYSDKNSTRIDFHYVRRLFDSKLLFLCQDTSDQKLCVKFTKRYSEEAHRHCADLGVAPGVYAVELLPGGWIMVVMQYLDDEIYERLLAPKGRQARLASEVRRVVGLLHQGNFVHGDVRGINLMVRRESGTIGEGKNVLLLDFDWAGAQDTTRYPPNVNCEIYRPPGAIDGELITQEHDIAMVDNMFK